MTDEELADNCGNAGIDRDDLLEILPDGGGYEPGTQKFEICSENPYRAEGRRPSAVGAERRSVGRFSG